MFKGIFNTPLEYLDYLFYRNEGIPHLFAIVTWGCSGSTWLAKVLNSHNEIFCLHCFNQHLSYIINNSYLNGISYLKSIAVTATGYKLAGDVHGINREELPLIREFFGENFKDVVLVRDPLFRLKSMISCLEKLKGGFSDYTYVTDLIKTKKLRLKDYSLKEVLFIHSVNMLNAIIEEKKFASKIVKFEDLIQSKTAITDLIIYLSNRTLLPNENWIDNVFSISKVNIHRGSKEITFNRHETYIIKKIINPEALEIYKDLGYDINFFIDC